MYARHSGFLFGVLLGFAPPLVQAQPVQIPAQQSVAPMRWDIGDGVCVTVVHVKSPEPGAVPFSSVDDALSVLNRTSRSWTEDARISSVHSVISFRNSDPLATGDFSNNALFPFSDNAGATPQNNDHNFALRLRGYINVDAHDRRGLQRTIGLYADDGARLSIGGQLITTPDVDQRVSARRIRQVEYGGSGLYPVELIYYQNGSLAVLELSQANQWIAENTRLTNLHDQGFSLLGEPGPNLFANTELYSSRTGAVPQCQECRQDSTCPSGNYCAKDWGNVPPEGLCQQCNVATHCGADCQSCPAATPVCGAGSCVQCLVDTHCTAGSRCDLTAHRCQSVLSDEQYLGGCSLTGGAGTPKGPAPSTLFGAFALGLLALAWLRRRRQVCGGQPVKYLLVGACALWPLGARADLSANTQTFQPAIGPENIITVEGSRTGKRLRPLVNVLLEYSHRPLRLVDTYGQPIANTVPDALSVHLMAGLGLTHWLALAADLPVVAYQGFDRTTPVADVPNQPGQYGLADLRVVAKLRLLNNQRSGFGFAFVPQFTFPTGDPLQLRGSGAYAIEPRLALDYRTRGGAVLALNAGFQGRTASQVVRRMEVASQVRYGLGLYVPVSEAFGLLGEVAGGTSVNNLPGGTLYSPLEGNVAARWVHASGVNVNLGTGMGFTQAVGLPQYRLFAAVGYLPIDRRPVTRPPAVGRLTVEKSGTGTGLVTSVLGSIADAIPWTTPGAIPGGLECGPSCAADFTIGTQILLQAHPGSDSSFTGWSGACSGTADCLVTVNGTLRVGAAFAQGQVAPAPPPQSPVTPATPPAAPAPVVIISDNKLDLQGRSIHFDTAQSNIAVDSFYLLDEVVQILNQHPQMRLRIEGHTDSVPFWVRGGNLQLSQERAAAVVQYLIDHGVTGDGVAGARLSSQGYGDSCPVATNQSPEGRQANRRTEFLLVDEVTGHYERTPCVSYTAAPLPRRRAARTSRHRSGTAVSADPAAAAAKPTSRTLPAR